MTICVVASFLGCQRCEDRGQTALQAVLPQLNQVVISNLVHEASVGVSNAAAQPADESYYMPSSAEAPMAHGLRPASSSEAEYGAGAAVVVHRRGAGAPYMSVRIPVRTGGGLCLWDVCICIKPGGGFAKDSKGWVIEDRSATATPIVQLSDEVLVYADRRSP